MGRKFCQNRSISNLKIQNGRQFFNRRKFFRKMGRVYCLDTLWVENFDKIVLSLTVKEIETILCFCVFDKNSKWRPFLDRRKLFKNWKIGVFCLDTLRVENFAKIALSVTVKKIEAFLCFCIFGKKFGNSKSPPFWHRRKFLGNWV